MLKKQKAQLQISLCCAITTFGRQAISKAISRAKDGKRKKQDQQVGPAYPYAKQRVKVLQAICWYVLRDRASFALLIALLIAWLIAWRPKVVVVAHSYQLV